MTEVQRTTTFPVRPADETFDAPHIRNAEGNCLPVSIIKSWTDSLAEDGGDAQRGYVPGQISAFVETLSDADSLSGEAPDLLEPDIWFGFGGDAEVELLLTYFPA